MQLIRYGLVVRIAGSHPAGPGSIPGNGMIVCFVPSVPQGNHVKNLSHWHCCNLLSRGNKFGIGFQVLLAERSFDLRTSGLWAQHASTAPLCSACSVSSF